MASTSMGHFSMMSRQPWISKLRIIQKRQVHIGGTVSAGYENVEKRFRKNFVDKYEPEGSALAVYHKGKLVVDLWSGYANKAEKKLWQENTMSVTFSTTKAVGSLCIALLVDRGHLSYDKKIGDYWPEFACNGKEEITVKMLVNQEAGLADFDEKITMEHAKNPELMSKLIERTKPVWKPGSQIGYHIGTYGWIADQLVQRADPQHRSVGKMFEQEIRQKFDVDWFIGLPKEHKNRVAKFKGPSLTQWLYNWCDPLMRNFYISYYSHSKNSLAKRVWRNPDWMFKDRFAIFNDPEFQRLEIVSGLGIGTARGLGKIFSQLGEGNILSQSTMDMIQKPNHVMEKDILMSYPVTNGWGFFHTYSPTEDVLIGHPGFGGQNVKVDCKNRLAIAYITNGCTTESGAFSKPWRFLQDAIFQSFYL